MKKIYTLIPGILLAIASHSQCTINSSLFGPPNNTNYSIIPDTITNLPIAYVGTPYNTDLQFHIQPDTVTMFGTFPITQVQIDSVTGIPANFTYLPNPSTGTFTTPTATPPGTGYGCVAVTGLAVAGQELGGPNSDGVYPLIVYYTATVVIFSVPTPEATTKTGYKLVIQPANGFNSYEIKQFSVATNSPNPADDHTDFRFNIPNAGNVNLVIYDVLGNVIKQDIISVAKGTAQYDLNTSELSSGVYLCSFRMGNSVVTKRITVSH
ncbi:MAG: T9SS type A sorting domain-containing protein [Bacteroidetes bacterium]|nr:T9SS type A sorting domain-containing protein [Bacteroidota bacterium]